MRRRCRPASASTCRAKSGSCPIFSSQGRVPDGSRAYGYAIRSICSGAKDVSGVTKRPIQIESAPGGSEPGTVMSLDGEWTAKMVDQVTVPMNGTIEVKSEKIAQAVKEVQSKNAFFKIKLIEK